MKISSVNLEISAVRRSQYPNPNKPEFLLVGRSNVGKSSFINTIINRKNFARTSSKPGKTQTLNFYLVNETFYLVDVPGYGFAMTSKKLRKKPINNSLFKRNFLSIFTFSILIKKSLNLMVLFVNFPIAYKRF